jgi:hypothetical protein
MAIKLILEAVGGSISRLIIVLKKMARLLRKVSGKG